MQHIQWFGLLRHLLHRHGNAANLSQWARIATVILVILVSTQLNPRASAAPTPAPPVTAPTDLASGAVNFQMAMLKGAYNTIKPPDASAAAHLPLDLQDLSTSFNNRMQAETDGAAMLNAANNFTIGVIGYGGMMAGGPTAIPVVAVVTPIVKQITADAFAPLLQESQDQAHDFLVAGVADFHIENGVSEAMLIERAQEAEAESDPNKRAIDYDEIAADLKTATTGTLDLAGTLKDSAGKQALETIVIGDLAQETTITLKATAQNSRDIKDLQSSVGEWATQFAQAQTNTIVPQLNQLQTDMTKLQGQIGTASTDITNLENHQLDSDIQLDGISEMLFQSLPPSQKLEMLNDDLVPGMSDEERTTEIGIAQSAADKQAAIDDAKDVADVSKDIATITNNLGIHDPNITKAANYTSIAASAFIGFASSNPVGYMNGIAAVSSLFGGGGGDANSAIMDKLNAIQTSINRVEKLQLDTLQRINDLNGKIDHLHEDIDQKFDLLDLRLDLMNDEVDSILQRPYGACEYSEEKIEGNGNSQGENTYGVPVYDFDSYSFRDSTAIYNWLTGAHDDIFHCADTLQTTFRSFNNPQTFQDPIAVDWLQQNLPRDVTGATAAGEPDTIETIKHFLADYSTSYELVSNYWKSNYPGLSYALMLQTLAVPVVSLPDIAQQKSTLSTLESAVASSGDSVCDTRKPELSHRLFLLLCARDESGSLWDNAADRAGAVAASQLSRPIDGDILNQYLQWATEVAPAYDLSGGNTNASYVSLAELRAGALSGAPRRGQELLRDALAVGDIGVAQTNMLHGYWLAQAVFDQVWDKTTHMPIDTDPKDLSTDPQRALALLPTENARDPKSVFKEPWLARNVALIALVSMERTNYVSAPGAALNPIGDSDLMQAYASAMWHFQKVADELAKPKPDTVIETAEFAEAVALMHSVFDLPPQVQFEVKLNPGVALIKFGQVALPLPSALLFSTRGLAYPSTMYNLLQMRGIMTQHYLEYNMLAWNSGDDLTSDQRDAVHRIAVEYVHSVSRP